MGLSSAVNRFRPLLLGGACLFFALALLAWPQQAAAAMRDGLSLCGNVLIPALFPFFVLSALVVELDLCRYLGRLFGPVMAPLFRVNGSCAAALALGLVGGYPVGARTALGLYQSGQCSRTEAQRMLAFCNNCGPAFLVGVVGAGIFQSTAVGLLLYGVHIAAAGMVGLLFRFYKPQEGPSVVRSAPSHGPEVRFAAAFSRSVTGALQSLLNLCAFLLFFTVFLRILSLSGLPAALAALLGLPPVWVERLLTGLLELSSGVTALVDGPITVRLTLAAFLLGWAGLSVHCQVMALLDNSGLSLGTHLVGKLLHGLLSAALAFLLSPLLTAAHAAFLPAVSLAPASALIGPAAAAWGIWTALLTLAVYVEKKAVEK
jgi:sporulation integral membrane protein YlbJ